MARFRIQESDFTAGLDPRVGSGFVVQSSPRPYGVDWLSHLPLAPAIDALIAEARHPLVLIDKRVLQLHLSDANALNGAPRFEVAATEAFKTISGALEVCEFLDRERATKSSTLFVIGGGIVQDVGAFAAAMYKRGLPWVYIPTTLLAQGDSGIGGKTGLNHKSAKNLLALFSAPRRVVIHTDFLKTLAREDVLSGLGEVLRLHITAGPDFLDAYEAGFKRFAAGEFDVLNELLVSALAAKRAIVERDEFELDLRRAMNYGHSVGHAFEALTDHEIPHGAAVTIGMLVENEISMRRRLLTRAERDRLFAAGKPLLSQAIVARLRDLNLDGVLDILARDKKTEGRVLKLVVVAQIGQIQFIDLPLEPPTVALLQESLSAVLAEL